MHVNATNAHESALSSLSQSLLPMPAWAQFAFHWALIRDYSLPRPLYDRVVNIRIARNKIAWGFPKDLHNWLKLGEAKQILQDEEGYQNCMRWVTESEMPDSMSQQEFNSLILQTLRQYISFYMWKGDFRKAGDHLGDLLAKPGSGTPQDLLLRAAFELYASQAAEDNRIRSAELKAAAITDLEAAKSCDPRVIQVFINLLRKDIAKALSVLWEEQGVVLESWVLNELPELASIAVRVDLSAGFPSSAKRQVAHLSLLSKDLRSQFIGKTLAVGGLGRGATFPFFFVYKILRTSICKYGASSYRAGIFTEHTKLTLIPGDAVYSRSQSSLLYAVGLHGIFGGAWAQRFKKGICWGTAVSWLIRTISGIGGKYSDDIDNAVRHKWDGGVKTLFHEIFFYQASRTLGLGNWHLHAGLNRRQANVFLHDPEILTEYISLLSGKNIGIIFTCGEHALSAVIGCSENEFALYFDSNNEEGDIILNSPKSLAQHVVDAMIVEDPITVQVYVKPESPDFPLLSEGDWLGKMDLKPADPIMEEMLSLARHLNSTPLLKAWKAFIERPH